jgi:hypothetical protein
MSMHGRSRSWTDPRDGKNWEIVFAPGVEEDAPAVRHMREGLVFKSDGVELHAPSPFGSDIEDLTEGDLEGLLDQAKVERARMDATGGWGREQLETQESDAA